MASKANKTLVLVDGERVPVTKEEGKWYICDDRRFRKLSGQISSVEEDKPEKVKEPAKKKKDAERKSDGYDEKEQQQ